MSQPPLTSAQENARRRLSHAMAGVCICLGLYALFNVCELKSEGVRTNGKVVGENRVLFATETGQGVEFNDSTQGMYNEITGDRVTVVYLRDDPRGSAIVERNLLVDARVAWGLLAFGAILLSRRRRAEDKAEDGAAGPDTSGFTSEKVERETPVLNNDGTFDSFTREPVMKYSLQRPGGPYGDWQLLQKFPKEGGLPNGFLLVAKDPPPQLVRALVPLAEKYGDDYYEFERTGDVVSVYCWEQGKSRLTKLAETLNALEA